MLIRENTVRIRRLLVPISEGACQGLMTKPCYKVPEDLQVKISAKNVVNNIG